MIWTHGGLDKLDVYRGLGVREVWIWKKDELKALADVHPNDARLAKALADLTHK